MTFRKIGDTYVLVYAKVYGVYKERNKYDMTRDASVLLRPTEPSSKNN
jgi:hypothetical protein